MIAAIGAETILMVFLFFCRIGSCLTFMPGFSSPRVPVQVRLFVAVSITLALAPILSVEASSASLRGLQPVALFLLIMSEVVIGSVIGLIGRFFFMALQFMASAAAMFIGFGNMPGAPVDDGEPLPALATFITLTATILLFLTEQHWAILQGLVESYSVLPMIQPISPQFNLLQVTDALTQAFLLSLQISAPFVAYSVVVNVMLGLAAKLTPQIPVYFISIPFVLAGGLFLLYFSLGEVLRLFNFGFKNWLATG